MIQNLTLLELNKNIQETLNNSFQDNLWVIAEISELKVNRNGHCYLELIEKDAITDNIIAKCRATIWAFTFRILRPYFENTTRHDLTPGIKVLVNAKVEFHELYGLSLNITDIDPNYTLGDLAQKKAEIIQKLENEGVLNMNKEVGFPLVPQKIAIISSESAAGYQDFMDQLDNNSFGYKFYTKLFPAIMQGIQAEDSIIKALELIYNYEDFFDIVVIIRGGGSQSDLSCFDNYLLAANVAQYPLPILTGIGHDKDESVTDIVAHKKLKTPTAVAEFIVDTTLNFESNLFELRDHFFSYTNEYLQNEKIKLMHLGTLINSEISNQINKQSYHLNHHIDRFKASSIHFLAQKKLQQERMINNLEHKIAKSISTYKLKINTFESNLTYKSMIYIKNLTLKLNELENRNLLLDPEQILKRGYSITYHNGIRIKDFKNISENDEIITQLLSGFIRSTVKGKNKKKPS